MLEQFDQSLKNQIAFIGIFDQVYAIFEVLTIRKQSLKLVLVARDHLDPKFPITGKTISSEPFILALKNGLSLNEFGYHWLETYRDIHRDYAKKVNNLLMERDHLLEQLERNEK